MDQGRYGALAGTVTVETIWRAALPPGTELLTGSLPITRSLSRVVVLRPRPGSLGALRGDELILVSMGALSALDPQLTLTRVIHSVADQAAAMVVLGTVPAEAVRQAVRSRMVLFKLPDSVSLAQTERDVLAYLAVQRTQWYERQHAVLHELTTLAATGHGFDALAGRMGAMTGLAVIFQDERGGWRGSWFPGEMPAEQRQHLLQAGGETSRPRIPTTGAPVPEGEDLVRLTVPLAVDGAAAGSASLFGRAGEVASWARLVLEAGATAGTIEIARERAVLATVDRIQGDLVADLVSFTADITELKRRTRRAGLDVEGSRLAVAFCLDPDGDGDPARAGQEAEMTGLRRRLERIANPFDGAPSHLDVPTHAEDHLLTLFYPVPAQLPPPAIRRAIKSLRAGLADTTSLSLSVSRVHAGLESFRRCFHEARLAAGLGRTLRPESGVSYFEDLGVYRLLLALGETEEMRAFHHDLLGKLNAYDRDKGTELVSTLDAYLRSSNAAEAAARLNLHRNSLLYRLRRIQEITALDLRDPETRFALHLALRIHDTLRSIN